jgi:hypothetical protein
MGNSADGRVFLRLWICSILVSPGLAWSRLALTDLVLLFFRLARRRDWPNSNLVTLAFVLCP